MRRLFVAAAMSGLLACQMGEPIDDVATTSQAIWGGDNFTTDFGAVCGMKIQPAPTPDIIDPDPFYCTCSHVGPGVVLTAASCLWDEREEEEKLFDDVDVRFGADPDFEAAADFAIEKIQLHRYYIGSEDGYKNNLAFIVLDSEPAFPLVTLNDRALTSEDVVSPVCSTGDPPTPNSEVAGCVTMIGYGDTEPNDIEHLTAGARKRVVTPLVAVAKWSIAAGENESTTCRGDTGGPAFMYFGSGLVQVAVHGRHPGAENSCSPTVDRTRVDKYLTQIIYPFIDQYGDTCGADSNCETGCPRTPDPDCDPCAWTGSASGCQEDCPTRDWDCPLGSFLGQSCAKNGDCEEGGRCVPAPDDETTNFCSRPCDPADSTDCPSGMECDTSDSAGECLWIPPSPGSQGFACNCETGSSCENSACRSGICEEEICVIECEPGGDPCPENYASPDNPYTCGASRAAPGKNVCLGLVRSGGGGFCTPSSVGKGGRGGWGAGALIAMGLLGLLLLRRRRHSA